MASIRKRGDSWEAFVSKNGVRKSATFKVKAKAQAWANQVELDASKGKSKTTVPNKTFGDLLEKYRDEVSVKLKGKREEEIRINRLLQTGLANVNLADLSPAHFSKWRDARLEEVSPATVRREWNQLSSVCNCARKEWGWLTINPLTDLKRPPEPVSRTRLFAQDEIDRICAALGYDPKYKPVTIRARVAAIMLLALETGMRAGEICALCWEDVHLDERWLKVTDGKTRAAVRDTPLTTEAVRILQQMEPGEGSVFGMDTRQLDANFRQGKARAGIAVEENLHFHDTRHNAITRLSKFLGVLELARAIGHSDIKQLMTYYNPKATDLAAALP